MGLLLVSQQEIENKIKGGRETLAGWLIGFLNKHFANVNVCETINKHRITGIT